MARICAVAGLVVVLAMTLPAAIQGHAGHFHLCPDTPSGRNYVRYEIGSCSSFTTLNTTANITATGKVTVWLYAYQNCSDQLSTALEFNTVLYANGAPLSLTNTTGAAYTGLCADPNKSIYVDDASLGTSVDENYIFWNPTLTRDNGTFCGNAANSIVARTVNSSGVLQSSPMQSFTLSTPDSGPALCCDFTLLPQPPLIAIVNQTAACYVPPSPAPSQRPPPPPPSGGAAASLRVAVSALFGVVLALALVWL
ncbi:hypothetical protein CHLRE_12g507800v5 [Chlamydomonas reinhardtii]|uniref:Pherophorin domain-containing protein n=1 Tax=Chlamydomonas reinhardtii TaxID=3055 RepID=A0A2K3D2S3_CHLRE|nr:uncharacterized protein CHLRE_12g507800v5 [Chlamydomonas reinhardtii]PNW74836.1 hypothetical protein CHLRE_12g507800v5 [Chlamydomonas reinhardtii]